MISVLVLGSGSATPRVDRNPSGILVNSANSSFLVDCGEGTQLQLRKYKQSLQRINHIFITHLHADHFLGLFGLISTQGMLGREKPLQIFAPKGMEEIIKVQMKITKSWLTYSLSFHEVDCSKSALIWEDKEMEVYNVPLDHKIACSGYVFKQKKKPRNILPLKIEQHKIPVYARKEIKLGADFVDEKGRVIPNSELTVDSEKALSFAYLSDTKVLNEAPTILNDVDLLYHEATFLNDMADRAEATHHSTAEQAAEFAAKCAAKKLILGHFSSRYDELHEFVSEAKPIFANVHVAEDGKWFSTE
ncbi:MAG: ribonuclease Z [Bacteroidetes bacterium]|nr:ribonuclease Z [Bacteroidota bacterium]